MEMDTLPENSLKAGVTMEQIRSALSASGYPLQIRVGRILRDMGFSTYSEWSFVDRDTKELRTVDIRAWKPLYDQNEGIRVRPRLDILIECKQSDLPFVFFAEEHYSQTITFPMVAGLKENEIKVITDDSRSTWIFTNQHALGFDLQNFATAPYTASIISKCQRKSKDLILSGDETYNSLVIPLIKAMSYLALAERPPETAVYFDAHICLGVAVIDAPMIVVKDEIVDLTSWVRVARHESKVDANKNDRGTFWYLDVIHVSALRRYIEDHIHPFADFASKSIIRHGPELASGKGFVAELEKHWPKSIEQVLRPRAR